MKTVKPLIGTFKSEFSFLDSEIEKGEWQYKLRFSDLESKDSFAIVFDGQNDVGNIYVEYQNEKFGIYYEDGQASFLTSRKNELGKYMLVDLTQAVRVEFNPNTKEIKINEKLLWDLSKSLNDGRDIDMYIDGFASYNVALEYTNNINATGKVLISSILGCDLSAIEPKENVAPALYADVRYHATVDEAWSIPQPVIHDLKDGDISATNAKISIVSESGEVLLNTSYKTGLSFAAKKEGNYYLLYNVADLDGNVTIQSFDFTAYKQPSVTYIVEKELKTETYGVGTQLSLPVCKAEHTLFRTEALRIAKGRLLKDSKILQTFDANEEYKYTFAQAGVYTLEYYLEDAKEYIAYEIVISADTPTLSFVQYQETYETGVVLPLQKATISLGAESKQADCVLITPDDNVITGNAATLETAGVYKVRYTALISNKPIVFEKIFSVGLSVDDILMAEPGSKAQISTHYADATLSGVKITSYPREQVTFASPIDFAAQQEGENFIELIAMARKAGEMEYNEFRITLTDAQDPSNQLIINCYAHDNAKKTFISVATAPNTPSLFKDGNSVREAYKPLPGRFEFMNHESLGVTTWHSFANTEESLREGAKNVVLKLRLDYQNRKLYAYAGNDEPVEVADFNDETFIQTWGKAFTGFTNGKAYCSIQYDHRKRVTLSWEDADTPQVCCSYLVTKFGGYDYTSGKIEDTIAPKISVASPQTISNAVVNKAYKIFDAMATDNTCGFVPVNVSVVFNYNQPIETSIDVKNGVFTPKVGGRYAIIYDAKDSFGNKTRVVEIIDAVAETALSPVKIQLNQQATKTLTGNKVYIADYKIGGGVGNYTIQTTVKNGDLEAKTFEDENGCFFIPEKDGQYIVSYKAIDYVGNVGESSYTVNIEKYAKPIFTSDPTMPLVLTAGVENYLPIVKAVDYYVYPSVEMQANVYVKYPKSNTFEKIDEPTKFILDKERVQTGDTVIIKYEVVGNASSNNVVSIEKEVLVANFDSRNGNVDYSEYFVTENATVYGEEAGVYTDCNANGSTLWFGKKLLADGFSFVINIGLEPIREIEFYLADSERGEQAIRVCMYQNGTDYHYTVNGGKETYKAECSNGEIIFRYDAKMQKVNLTSTNSAGTYVFVCEDGEVFNGFNSGYVYMRMRVLADTTMKIRLRELGNQTLFATGEDSGAPVIVTEKDYGGSADVGKAYEIPKAIAGDIIAFVGDIKVTVRDTNGEYMTAIDGTLLKGADASKAYYIVPTVVGKHTIRYTCDDTNMVGAITYNVNLYVSRPIQKAEVSLTLNKKVATSAKVNTKYTLPTATPSAGANVICAVFGPTHQIVEQTEGVVTFELKGVYSVIYTVFDDIGNARTYKYYVTVK